MNRFQLIATIAERDVLRFTPAGVPIVGAILMHDSQQVEAGVARQVAFEIPALGAGEISGRLESAELGAAYRFDGFLARKNRNSKALVFHIIDFSAA
ncbi:MAG: primosomal replication protein N [Janthinobacterium lividum]|uniref:Replication restart protein PriB n=1 Tax=Massilia varians TaxID=457921 RepID=A0ABN6TDP5_9BURK|nr:primosomal replication protein N [Massilia varians]BDT60358.1 primosomal replication protein N [Massilia varians]